MLPGSIRCRNPNLMDGERRPWLVCSLRFKSAWCRRPQRTLSSYREISYLVHQSPPQHFGPGRCGSGVSSKFKRRELIVRFVAWVFKFQRHIREERRFFSIKVFTAAVCLHDHDIGPCNYRKSRFRIPRPGSADLCSQAALPAVIAVRQCWSL